MASLQASALQCAEGFSAPIAAGRAVGGLGARRMVNWRAVFGAVIALALAAGPAGAATWRPEQREPFDFQSVAPFNFTRLVGIMLLGVNETSLARVQELQARGVRTVCVINAGAWENWRPDSGADDRRRGRQQLCRLAGRALARHPRRRRGSADRCAKRLDLCQSKGFDGVLFDNVDGYANTTGFPLTAKDQLAFNRWLAAEAHARGLAVGPQEHLAS